MIHRYEIEFTIRGERKKINIECEDLFTAAKRAQIKIRFSYPREEFEILGITCGAEPTMDPRAEQTFRNWDPLHALTLISEALHAYAPPLVFDEFERETQNLEADGDRRKAIFISLAALVSVGVHLPNHLMEEYEALSAGFYPIYFGLQPATDVEANDALQHVALTLCHSWNPPKSAPYERFVDGPVKYEANALAFGFLMAVGTLDGSGVEYDPTYMKVYNNLLPLYLEANPSEPVLTLNGPSHSPLSP